MPGNNRAAIAYVTPNAPPIMCTVADISEGGAGLTFVTIATIPDTFELEIKGESELRKCKVAWRSEPHRMGVQFIERLRPPLRQPNDMPCSAGAVRAHALFVDAEAGLAQAAREIRIRR